jgi:hypothetical protein
MYGELAAVFHVAAIRKVVSVVEYPPDVRSASGGTDATDRREVLPRTIGWINPVLVRHRVSFSTALVSYHSCNY